MMQFHMCVFVCVCVWLLEPLLSTHGLGLSSTRSFPPTQGHLQSINITGPELLVLSASDGQERNNTETSGSVTESEPRNLEQNLGSWDEPNSSGFVAFVRHRMFPSKQKASFDMLPSRLYVFNANIHSEFSHFLPLQEVRIVKNSMCL